VQPVAVRKNNVVYPQILENLNNSQRCAWQYAFFCVRRVQEANVLVHVENVAMRQTLNILVDGYNLLEVLILSIAENRVVDNYAVHLVVVVCIDEGVLEEFTVDLTEVESEATTPRLALNSMENIEMGKIIVVNQVLTFQYTSCPSTQHTHEQRDRSSKGSRRGVAFARSYSSHL